MSIDTIDTAVLVLTGLQGNKRND